MGGFDLGRAFVVMQGPGYTSTEMFNIEGPTLNIHTRGVRLGGWHWQGQG